jgi:hypothetical protein
MIDLLSKRVARWTGGVGSWLPTTSKNAVESNKQRDGKKSAAGEAMSSVAMPVSVVPVGAEVRAIEAIGVPERSDNKTENQRDCDEDEDGWDNDKSKHCVFSIQTALRETRLIECRYSVSLEKSGRVGFAVFTRLHRFDVGHQVVKVHS